VRLSDQNLFLFDPQLAKSLLPLYSFCSKSQHLPRHATYWIPFPHCEINPFKAAETAWPWSNVWNKRRLREESEAADTSEAWKRDEMLPGRAGQQFLQGMQPALAESQNLKISPFPFYTSTMNKTKRRFRNGFIRTCAPHSCHFVTAQVFKYKTKLENSTPNITHRTGCNCFADDEEVETEVGKWLRLLCCGYRSGGTNVSMLVDNISRNKRSSPGPNSACDLLTVTLPRIFALRFSILHCYYGCPRHFTRRDIPSKFVTKFLL
jgi:hypothetical protein